MSDMDAESSADEGQMNTETEEEVDSQGEEEEAADEEQVELEIMKVFWHAIILILRFETLNTFFAASLLIGFGCYILFVPFSFSD